MTGGLFGAWAGDVVRQRQYVRERCARLPLKRYKVSLEFVLDVDELTAMSGLPKRSATTRTLRRLSGRCWARTSDLLLVRD